jgi:hypothetical protein
VLSFRNLLNRGFRHKKTSEKTLFFLVFSRSKLWFWVTCVLLLLSFLKRLFCAYNLFFKDFRSLCSFLLKEVFIRLSLSIFLLLSRTLELINYARVARVRVVGVCAKDFGKVPEASLLVWQCKDFGSFKEDNFGTIRVQCQKLFFLVFSCIVMAVLKTSELELINYSRRRLRAFLLIFCARLRKKVIRARSLSQKTLPVTEVFARSFSTKVKLRKTSCIHLALLFFVTRARRKQPGKEIIRSLSFPKSLKASRSLVL